MAIKIRIPGIDPCGLAVGPLFQHAHKFRPGYRRCGFLTYRFSLVSPSFTATEFFKFEHEVEPIFNFL